MPEQFSRGDLIGSSPTSGDYTARPVPFDPDQLQEYLSDELISVGSRINDILQSGGWQPTSELPTRWREGMSIYFTNAPDDVYTMGDNKGERVISSAGVWLYKQGKWWKLINDPTESSNNVFVYQLTNDNTQPSTPVTGVDFPPPSWLEHPPSKNVKEDYIWASAQIGYNPDTLERTWGVPTIWSGGSTDGFTAVTLYLAYGNTAPVIDDVDARNPTTGGVPWVATYPPTDGTNPYIYSSANLVDGSNSILYPWSDPSRLPTPDSAKPAFAHAVGTKNGFPTFDPDAIGYPGPAWTAEVPVLGADDFLWQTNRIEWLDLTDPDAQGEPLTPWVYPIRFSGISPDFTETRYFASVSLPSIDNITVRIPKTSGVDWTLTIPTNRPTDSSIYATTATFSVGEVNLTNWSSPALYASDGIDGSPGAGFYSIRHENNFWNGTWPTDASARFQSEFGFPPSANDVLTFYVDGVDGNSPATINTRRYTGSTWLVAASIIDGDLIAKGTIVGESIVASARMEAPLIIGGELRGGQIDIGNGSFTVDSNGRINAESAIFRDNIQIISNGNANASISIGPIGNPAFTVNSAGIVTATGGNFGGGAISGGTINGSVINGGSINVPTSGSPKFQVDSQGNMMCNDAIINGTIFNDGAVNNGEIVGSAIFVPNKSSPKFTVNSSGNMTCQDATISGNSSFAGTLNGVDGTFTGTIEAEQILGDVVSSATRAYPRKSLGKVSSNQFYPYIFAYVNNSVNYNRTMVFNLPAFSIRYVSDNSSQRIDYRVQIRSGGSVVYETPQTFRSLSAQGTIVIPLPSLLRATVNANTTTTLQLGIFIVDENRNPPLWLQLNDELSADVSSVALIQLFKNSTQISLS